MSTFPPGAWVRARYEPTDQTYLTEHQQVHVGETALFRAGAADELMTPASWRSVITVRLADLQGAETVAAAEGMAAWRADLMEASERAAAKPLG